MDNARKRWVNLEKEATKGVAAPFWSIPSVYTVPQGYELDIRFISFVCDVTQVITKANLAQYKGLLYFNNLSDEGVSFYAVPSFAQFPYPFRKIVDENQAIAVYFESSVALTFDYILVRISGWLRPKNIPWDLDND